MVHGTVNLRGKSFRLLLVNTTFACLCDWESLTSLSQDLCLRIWLHQPWALHLQHCSTALSLRHPPATCRLCMHCRKKPDLWPYAVMPFCEAPAWAPTEWITLKRPSMVPHCWERAPNRGYPEGWRWGRGGKGWGRELSELNHCYPKQWPHCLSQISALFSLIFLLHSAFSLSHFHSLPLSVSHSSAQPLRIGVARLCRGNVT